MSGAAPTLGRLLGSWSAEPATIVVCGSAGALYLLGARRLGRAWPALRTLSFSMGLAVLATALLSGIDAYADELLSIHTVQHLLLLFVAPPLLLWGAPVRLALGAARRTATRRAIGRLLTRRWVRALTRPAFGFSLFTAAVLGTHLTGIYELALRHQGVHDLEHAAYFWSGMLLLAPLIASDPIPHPPGPLARFNWMMAAMTVMAIPSGFFLFDPHVLYSSYVSTAHLLHRSALADQRAAGAVMLVGGGTVMALLAMVLATQGMLAEERRQRRRELYEDARGAPARAATVGAREDAVPSLPRTDPQVARPDREAASA